jgi:hypothetical protein
MLIPDSDYESLKWYPVTSAQAYKKIEFLLDLELYIPVFDKKVSKER